MLIIWKGRGIVVPLSTIAALLGANFVFDAIGGKDYYSTHGFAQFAAFAAAAVAVWLVGTSDESGGTFFFVPTQFWAPILIVVGIVMSMSADKPAATPSTPSAQLSEPAQQLPALTPVPKPPARAPAELNLSTPTLETPPAAAPTPVHQEPERATPAFEQVWIDQDTKTYYPESCGQHPEGTTRMAKSIATRQGYQLATPCLNR